MALNPLAVGAGAAIAWLLTRSKTPAGSVPSDSGMPAVDPAKAAAIQNTLNVINAGIAAGTMKQAVVRGAPMIAPLPAVLPLILASGGGATMKISGVADVAKAISDASRIDAPNFALRLTEWPAWPGAAKPFAAYYWKIRNSINYLMGDVLDRMTAEVPTISVVSMLQSATFSPDGVKVNPLSGFGNYTTGGLLNYKVQGVDPASLLKIVLTGIYSAIEELSAYNTAYRRFLTFKLGFDEASKAARDAATMDETVFWNYVTGTLLASRIVAGEEWNAGVDLKYGDSGVNLHEVGYSWLQSWARSTFGSSGAQTLLASSHAVGACMAISAAAYQGYSQFWPGDAQFVNAINANTVAWTPVPGSNMLQDPASNIRIDPIKSRDQHKPVVFIPNY